MSISFERKELVWHILFWIGYLFIRLFFVDMYGVDMKHRFLFSLMDLPLKLLTFYVLVYYLIPTFALSKRFWELMLYSLLLFVSIAILRRFVPVFGIYPYLVELKVFDPNMPPPRFWDFRQIIGGLTYIYPIAGLGIAIFFTRGWFKKYVENQVLEKQKLTAELAMLKSQIHPHFLFNTLNNIYALALNRSEETPNAVVKLSDLLSYMIYDCREEKVLLSKEVEHLKGYIELERLRYSDKLDFSLDIDESDIHGKYIAPLLIIPFLENSFKHGVSNALKNAWISMTIWIENDQFNLVIENSLAATNHPEKSMPHGVGLQNVQKRLDLLYPEQHQLTIRETESSYLVKLRLDLI